jgi:hypothetical protein
MMADAVTSDGDAERITFTFPDATTFSIDVPPGKALATIDAIVKRKGIYESGWVRDSVEPTVFYNLHAAVRMQILEDI